MIIYVAYTYVFILYSYNTHRCVRGVCVCVFRQSVCIKELLGRIFSYIIYPLQWTGRKAGSHSIQLISVISTLPPTCESNTKLDWTLGVPILKSIKFCIMHHVQLILKHQEHAWSIDSRRSHCQSTEVSGIIPFVSLYLQYLWKFGHINRDTMSLMLVLLLE